MARHQIIVIGRRMETALIGVKEFHPDVLHLLYTEVTSDVYEPMLRMLAGKVRAVEYAIDPYDYEKTKHICCEICETVGLEGNEFQFNVTEGTKVAAAAAFAAAVEKNQEAIYYTQEGERINITGQSRGPIDARLDNREIIELFGNTLAAYNPVDEMQGIDVAAAYDVKRFIEKYPRYFHRIQKQFRSDYGKRLDRLPSSFMVEREKNVTVRIDAGRMKIVDRGKTVFDCDNGNAARLFFTGRWWEVIVSDKVNRWDHARHADQSECEVWRNVEFSLKGSAQTKNELDILVNDRTRLLLIECKSGYIAQENIYKIDSTRRTYGGSNSKGALVSYYPLEDGLIEKCRDLHLYWFAPPKDEDRVKWLDGLPAWLDTLINEME